MGLTDIMSRDLTTSPSREGLTQAQAERILETEGANAITGKKQASAAEILVGQFKDVLVLILLVCTAVSVFMGEYIEAIAIAVIVLLNAAMGAAQEYKTEKTIKALKEMAAPRAKVIRDGKEKLIPAFEVVRGDIIKISEGDCVPADAFIISQNSLFADESMLTGESVPVAKEAALSEKTENAPGQPDIIYMGSVITKGNGKARVIATGMKTQMGKIAGMINEIKPEMTPLQKQLSRLGKQIGIGCLAVCAAVSMFGILRGEDPFKMLITGVSLAVAAVPEGLPAIVTISLALAVGRMVKKNALMRRLHAVETLGCAGVLCSDKTGTLTQNKMTVKQLYVSGTDISVSGDGYSKSGDFKVGGKRVNIRQNTAAEMLLHTAVMCNNAGLSGEEFVGRDRAANSAPGEYSITGDPTEAALLVMAGKAGVFKSGLKSDYEILDEIPFDSKRKMMSVIVKNKAGKKYILTKGAPDVLVKRCTQIYDMGLKPMTAGVEKEILEKNSQMAKNALRVLGFAYKELNDASSRNPEGELVFLGLAGMKDPPRPEVKKAVKTCMSADIKTVMITGDHKDTACAVAKELSIFRNGDLVVTGEELDRMDDNRLAREINSITVFARVNPEHKLRIVRAFKRAGHVVAMTGDGVNDAPAVKEADIGVSMGISGTDVTKQAADVILLDDNFATLVAAVEEGRVIYSNIRKFIRYLLSCNVGEVLTMFLGMVMGMPAILTPLQILAINLVTDGLPAIALGLEPPEERVMNRKPRSKGESVFAGGLFSKIIFRGIFIALSTLAAFVTFYKNTLSLEKAETAAFLALVFAQLIHVFECKNEEKNIFSVPYFNNFRLIWAVIISLGIVLAIIYTPALAAVFSVVPLSGGEIFLTVVYSAAVPVLSAGIGLFTGKKSNRGSEYVCKIN